MKTWVATPATTESFTLGEGPIWDAERQVVLWVDITAGAVLEAGLDGDVLTSITRREFSGTVGAVCPATGGGILVAGQEHLFLVAADGTRTEGPRIVAAGEPRRLNDGSPDPAGRYVVGTLAFEPSTAERLVRVRWNGQVETIDDDLTLSNGLAWNRDDSLMYSVDTMTGNIWARPYDPVTGTIGPRRRHLHITDGYPDGICMDTEDNLWIAIWGRGEVRRFDASGTHIGSVVVPAPHTSCPAFAGPNLDLLVITTATEGLTPAQLEEFPLSGCVFTAHVDAVGVPVPAWSPDA